MRPIQLSFTGPWSFKVFEIPSIQSETVTPGILIWGFPHPVSKKFIPYSVDYTSQSINDHLATLRKNIFDLTVNTISWLSEDYLFGLNEVKPFYNDKKFPCVNDSELYAGTQHLPLWYSIHKSYFDDKFVYLNNREFLLKKYLEIPISAEYPISALEGRLDTIVPYIDTLQFCCATVDNADRPKFFFEFMQAYIQFLLKGKTINNSLNYSDLHYLLQNDMQSVSIRNINGNRDPLKYLFKEEISLDFPGY